LLVADAQAARWLMEPDGSEFFTFALHSALAALESWLVLASWLATNRGTLSWDHTARTLLLFLGVFAKAPQGHPVPAPATARASCCLTVCCPPFSCPPAFTLRACSAVSAWAYGGQHNPAPATSILQFCNFQPHWRTFLLNLKARPGMHCKPKSRAARFLHSC
jgi:hypothetical protein